MKATINETRWVACINLLDDDDKFTYADVQLQKPSTVLCDTAEKKVINARFWIEAIGSVLQGPKKERVELAVRDEDGVKRRLVFFESLVELPLEMEDTILCIGLMASEYGGNIGPLGSSPLGSDGPLGPSPLGSDGVARCMYHIGRCEGGICVHDRFGAQ